MQRKSLLLLCILFCVTEALRGKFLNDRLKRQECQCVKNNIIGGVKCNCSNKRVFNVRRNAEDSSMEIDTVPLQDDSSQQLNNVQPYHAPHAPLLSQPACGCFQIIFVKPQYQCQCGGTTGYTVPSTSTTTTTTTEAPTTTTTTLAPITYPPTPESTTVPTYTQGPGKCQCIMIQIFEPASAQYQCNCVTDNQFQPINDETLPTPPPEVIVTEETIPPTTIPPETPEPVTEPPPPVTVPGTTPMPPAIQYPLTTTCAVYAGVVQVPCLCLPQYDQCAPNICCLKPKYRSYKQSMAIKAHNDIVEPKTVDLVMDILKNIKKKLTSN